VAVWRLAVPVTIVIAVLNFELAPRAASAEADLRSAALRAGILAPIEAGRFRSFGGGHTVVYARATDPEGDLIDVFVKRGEGAVIETTVARRAHYAVSADGDSETITLYNGERIEGTPGSNRYRIMRFDEQLIPLRTPEAARRAPRLDELGVRELEGSADPKLRAELQWRLGLPVLTLVITALAIPLGRLRPRQGRYAHVWLAVLVFALYANLALAGRSWLAHGQTPFWLGLWWVHAIFIFAALVAAALPRVQRLRARYRGR
jgi:lipopolysaccharide export system permease protein